MESIKKHIEGVGKWIRRVQRLSENKKKIWLILLSGVSMTFIVLLWLAYINVRLPKLAGVEEEEEVAAEESQEASFFEILGEGIEIIGARVSGEVGKAREGVRQIWEATEFSVEGGDQNLAQEKPEELPVETPTSTEEEN